MHNKLFMACVVSRDAHSSGKRRYSKYVKERHKREAFAAEGVNKNGNFH